MSNGFENCKILWASPSFDLECNISRVYSLLSLDDGKEYYGIVEFDDGKPARINVFNSGGHIKLTKEEEDFLTRRILEKGGIKWTS